MSHLPCLAALREVLITHAQIKAEDIAILNSLSNLIKGKLKVQVALKLSPRKSQNKLKTSEGAPKTITIVKARTHPKLLVRQVKEKY